MVRHMDPDFLGVDEPAERPLLGHRPVPVTRGKTPHRPLPVPGRLFLYVPVHLVRQVLRGRRGRRIQQQPLHVIPGLETGVLLLLDGIAHSHRQHRHGPGLRQMVADTVSRERQGRIPLDNAVGR